MSMKRSEWEVGCPRSHSSVNRQMQTKVGYPRALVIPCYKIITFIVSLVHCVCQLMDIPIIGMGREEGISPACCWLVLQQLDTRTARSPLCTLKASELGIVRTPIFSCYNNLISLRCTLGHTDDPLEVCDRWTPADTGSICSLAKPLRGRSGRYPPPPWTRDLRAHSWAWGLLEGGTPQTPFTPPYLSSTLTPPMPSH